MLTFLHMRCPGLLASRLPGLPAAPVWAPWRATTGALALTALALLPAALPPGGALPGVLGAATAAENPAPPDAKAPRPAGLVILQEKLTREGPVAVGVFGAKDDPLMPGTWSVKVWEEKLDRVTIATDKIRCSPQGPMRVTGTASRLIVRELNPGGPITSANRLDHLIWWAVCVPAQAGKDPATLGALAHSLGYSGQLVEREEVLVVPRR